MTLLNHHRYAVFFSFWCLYPSWVCLPFLSFRFCLAFTLVNQTVANQQTMHVPAIDLVCLSGRAGARLTMAAKEKLVYTAAKKKVSVSQGEVYFLLEFFLLFWTYNHKKERLNERTELQNKEIIGRLPLALCDFEVLPTCVVDIHGCRSDCHLCASN